MREVRLRQSTVSVRCATRGCDSRGPTCRFTDIIGRQFKQPKEGLWLDNSPTAHMWRSLANPDRPL